MKRNLRWMAIASMAINLLLLQALGQQTGELTSLHDEVGSYRATIASLEAERETASVELAVLDVLDSHRLRVDPGTRRSVAQTIVEVAHRYDLAPELILAVIFTESSFDPDAESVVGAVGLMQLMPATATQLADELEMEWKGLDLLTDPQINILLGSFYLRKMLHRFDDLDAALAAYNVGPNRLTFLMSRNGQTPRAYARKVQRVSESLRERFF